MGDDLDRGDAAAQERHGGEGDAQARDARGNRAVAAENGDAGQAQVERRAAAVETFPGEAGVVDADGGAGHGRGGGRADPAGEDRQVDRAAREAPGGGADQQHRDQSEGADQAQGVVADLPGDGAGLTKPAPHRRLKR